MAEPQSMTRQPRSRRWLLASRTVLVLIMATALLVGCAQEGPTSTPSRMPSRWPSPGPACRSLRPEQLGTGYFEAEIVAALLRELGYDVSSPAEREMGPDVFYPAVASRLVDFWANGWFPLHDAKLETALPARASSATWPALSARSSPTAPCSATSSTSRPPTSTA